MSETWTVLRILDWTGEHFSKKGIEGGRREAELLLADLLRLDRVGLYLQFDRPLQAEELTAFRARVERRARREPLQYILGEAEFWSLPLHVNPAVLIPRPDTEILVEEALRVGRAARTLLDVGTGSGAVALALARELPDLRVDAVDLSEEALAVAAENALRNDLSGQVAFRREDLRELTGGPFDLVVSNPPYIPAADIASLMPEVRDFEPRLALDGGSDGLEAYRALAAQSQGLLAPGGWLLVEVGIAQAEAVRALFAAAGLGELFIRPDYAGIDRVVGGRRPGQG